MKYETAKEIEVALSKYFKPRVNIIVPCVSWGINIHECDMLVLSKHGYATEIEIKISIADLKKDKEKNHAHYDERIKQFFFAIPKKIFNEDIYNHIPDRAGLLVVKDSGHTILYKNCIENKNARKWTDEERLKLTHLSIMRYWKLRDKMRMIEVNKNNIKRYDFFCHQCSHVWISKNKYNGCPKCNSNDLEIEEVISNE